MDRQKEVKKNTTEDKYISTKITLKEAIQIGHENKRFNRHLRDIKNQRKGTTVFDDNKKEIFTIPKEPIHNLVTEHNMETNKEFLKDINTHFNKEETLSNNQIEIIYKHGKKTFN